MSAPVEWEWLGLCAFDRALALQEAGATVVYLVFATRFENLSRAVFVLDWLLLCTITPSWAIVPGTEGNPGNKDYAFHFRGFLIGSLLSAAIAVIVAAVVGFL